MAGRAGKITWNFRELSLAVALAGCASAGAGAGADAGSAASADVAACTVEPHLKTLEVQYFANSCALSHCHDTASPLQGNLDLSMGKSFQSLVNVAAFQANAAKEGKILVVPGHPEESFLYEKLTATTDGVLMPYGAAAPYDPDCSVAMVKKWIENGALDD